MNKTEPTFILIIDDELSICTGVSGLLEMEGYRTDYVMSAQEGLKYIENKCIPDIILLDVNLGSDINGIDALGMIKEKNKYIQVVMFTSQDSLDICLECMKRGALDFLTKPFDLQLFTKIVATAIERKNIEQIRDLYFDMVIHDLKNPLQVISGAYEMLSDDLNNSCTPIQKRLLEATDNGIKQVYMIINNVIGITKFEKNSLAARHETFDAIEAITNAIKTFDNVELSHNLKSTQIRSDKDLFTRIVTNIVSNASRFATPGTAILIYLEEDKNSSVIVTITNAGSFIPENLRDIVFDKFLSIQSTVRDIRGQNFGLGLTFSKMAVSALNGKIWIEGQENPPTTTFKFNITNYLQ